MSELQAGSFGRPGDPVKTRLNTAGRPAPGTRLRVVDSDGKALEAGHEGELEVTGPSVFDGYLNNDAETAAAFTGDGWFRTGDLAVIDAGGYVTLTGRVKEIINRGGVKYNPIDIELLIMTLDAVEACAIVPYSDPVLGERACLFVSQSAPAPLELADITALLEHKGIARYKWPERLKIITDMPMTPTRKVMRGVLKDMV